MQIKTLLEELEYTILAGSNSTEVTTLVYDSRKVEKGSGRPWSKGCSEVMLSDN